MSDRSRVMERILKRDSCMKRKRFPRKMEELMVLPDDFGVGEEDRIDILIRSMEDTIENMGIRIIYKEAKDVKYQNMLGLNVLTIRI